MHASSSESELRSTLRVLEHDLLSSAAQERCVASARDFLRALDAVISRQRDAPADNGDLDLAVCASCLIFAASRFSPSAISEGSGPTLKRTVRPEPEQPQVILMPGQPVRDADSSSTDQRVSIRDSKAHDANDGGVPFHQKLAIILICSTFGYYTRDESTLDACVSLLAVWVTFQAKAFLSKRNAAASQVMPWRQVLSTLETVVATHVASSSDDDTTTSAHLPLPEDWLMRGLDWAATTEAYPKGVWQTSASDGSDVLKTALNDETPVRDEGSAMEALQNTPRPPALRRARYARLVDCLNAVEDVVDRQESSYVQAKWDDDGIQALARMLQDTL